jgi:phenylpropionate dioxygenase-like ring-hydroxylating dioxygenase large terminal subunit
MGAMTPGEIATLRALMEYEAGRRAPPAEFPKLPDLPGGRYTDPCFMALEKAHLWRKSWLLAGHTDEVAQPGCFKLWEDAGQPVVIIRARSGAINAFYNTCSHRGAAVVTEASGRRARLTCKYHGWTYDDEGALVSIRDPEDFADFDFACRPLRKVRCETFGALIFVNFDPEAPSLRDWLGPIADEWEEFRFDRLRLIDHYSWDLKSNWKVAMEANTEVYHVKSIHPSTVAVILDDRRNVNSFYAHGHGRMIAPNPAAGEAGGRRGPAQMDTPSVGEIARTCTQSYGIFPNVVSPLGPGAFPMLQFWPNGIDRSRMDVWWFGPDWGDGDKPEGWAEVVSGFNQVLEEDTAFGAWIQKSHESYAFESVPLSYQEARIYWWNQAADALIGPDNIPPDLRVEPVIGDAWVHPNDPRLAHLKQPASRPREEIPA